MSLTHSVLRTNLFVTTALRLTPELEAAGRRFAGELYAPFIYREGRGLSRIFSRYPESERALVVQADRLLLVHREGTEFFFHPNLAYLRLGNVLKGKNDFLLEAADAAPGDRVLDATLGFGGEASLLSWAVGESGEVHGIEAIPELGIVVREGLQTTETAQEKLNQAMRRIKVVHLGDHSEYLSLCPDNHYDIVYFDPFFEKMLEESLAIAPLRAFGFHQELSEESLHQARRIARRRVVVKTERLQEYGEKMIDRYPVAQIVGSPTGKVVYHVIPALPVS